MKQQNLRAGYGSGLRIEDLDLDLVEIEIGGEGCRREEQPKKTGERETHTISFPCERLKVMVCAGLLACE